MHTKNEQIKTPALLPTHACCPFAELCIYLSCSGRTTRTDASNARASITLFRFMSSPETVKHDGHSGLMLHQSTDGPGRRDAQNAAPCGRRRSDRGNEQAHRTDVRPYARAQASAIARRSLAQSQNAQTSIYPHYSDRFETLITRADRG